jgi:hypothetical protein
MQFGLFVGLLIIHGLLKCVFLLANVGCRLRSRSVAQLVENSRFGVFDSRFCVRQHRHDVDHYHRLIGNYWPREHAPGFVRVHSGVQL